MSTFFILTGAIDSHRSEFAIHPSDVTTADEEEDDYAENDLEKELQEEPQ